MGDKSYDMGMSARCGNLKTRRFQWSEVNGSGDGTRVGPARLPKRFSIQSHQFSIFEHSLGGKLFEVGCGYEIGSVAGRDSTFSGESEVSGRIETRHDQGVYGIETVSNRFSHSEIDVSLVDKISGFPVVGAEKAAGECAVIDGRQQIHQIFGDGTLSYHQVETHTQFFQSLFRCGALMIGFDASDGVGEEIFAAHFWSVSI